MTRARTVALLLAAVALSAASPLAQAASTTALLEQPYGLGPTTHNDMAGRDTSIHGYQWTQAGIFQGDESHCNKGATTSTRVLKAFQHTYLADWDTGPMLADLDPGGALMVGPLLGQSGAGTYGWGPYAPNYYMAVKQRDGGSYWNDNGTPEDPLDDFINSVSPNWPTPGINDNGTPEDTSDDFVNGLVNVSSVWSTNDWFEGDGLTAANYAWSDPIGDYAVTIWYAGDTIIPEQEIYWSFPGGGLDPSTGEPWPAFDDCTFIETFHSLGDYRDFSPDYTDPDDYPEWVPIPHGDGWDPEAGVPKTPTNSTSWTLDNTAFFVNDSGTPEDDSDDFYEADYVELQLDQALMDDMFNNEDNRGLAFWEWATWSNGAIFSNDQNAGDWPYIHGRFDVLTGDGNIDGNVDGLDYVTWSNNYEPGVDGKTWAAGDYNLDGYIDGLDYVAWSNNYGESILPGAVPEPATMALLAMGALALLKRRPRS